MALTNEVLANEVIIPVETDCSICSDKYTAVVRKRITCKYCKKGTCSKCIEQYLLTRMEDAHCVHCRVHYNDKDLQEFCTKTYLKDRYFKHRQEILINRERAALPALQEAAHLEKMRRQRLIESNAIAEQIRELATLRNQIRMEFVGLKIKDPTNPQEDLVHQMEVLMQQINHLKNEFYQISVQQRQHIPPPTESVEEKKEDERRKFIRRCMRANCNGFLSTAWKCGLCDWYSCSKCFTERGQNHDSPHECKKEDIETADLIRSDSKPCPNCGEFIN